ATARRVAGRTPAINCQASNKVKKPILPDGLFCVCGEHSRCDLDVGLISAAHQAIPHHGKTCPATRPNIVHRCTSRYDESHFYIDPWRLLTEVGC
ncbi:hypothetical protein M5Y73_11705, partial [Citrobacter cronae]|nr:hypothetical protein [Citrobacter cronae]